MHCYLIVYHLHNSLILFGLHQAGHEGILLVETSGCYIHRNHSVSLKHRSSFAALPAVGMIILP